MQKSHGQELISAKKACVMLFSNLSTVLSLSKLQILGPPPPKATYIYNSVSFHLSISVRTTGENSVKRTMLVCTVF